MVKFAHLLVLTVLTVWIAGAGCVGNDSSDVDGGVTQNVDEAGNASDLGITPAEILELNNDMEDLENLLANASLEEEIEIEEI